MMIMPRGQQLLLPVSPLFMLFTMAFALLLDMLQSMGWTGNAAWAPDWLALVLVFWAIHQPLRVGVGVAFVLGLLTDVHQTSLLGQHALTYTVQGYLATMIHRRILWFDVPSQALQVLPVFMLFTMAFALLLDMLQSMGWTGNAAWAPDWLALVLVFWAIHQPLRVGVGVAFVLGLLTDVHQTSLLGQHALTYTVQGYLATMIHRRILWFDVPSQALQVLPVFMAAQLLELGVRIAAGGLFPGWSFVIPPLLQALMWPLVTVILLAPQRRAPDPDKHRPL